MAKINVSSQELDAILGELEGELNGILASTQAGLKKAREEDGSPSPGMGSASASAGSPSAGSPSASAGGSPSAGGAPEMGGAPGGAVDPAAAGGDPGMDPGAGGDPGMDPGAAAGGDPAAGGDAGAMDPQALEAEYSQLPLEELKAHYLAAKAALFAMMQQGGGEAGAPGAAPPGPSAAPAGPPPGPSAGAPPPGGAPPMAMSEGKAVAGVSQSGNGGQVAKSESDLQAQVDALTKIVTAFVNKPMQKAITGATYVGKSEEAPARKSMNTAEVTAKLSELTRSPDLKKSDRDLITGYYEGRTNLTAIEHLLK